MATQGGRHNLRILCLGDSLTGGYSRYGAIHHPYSGALEMMLTLAMPGFRVETTVDGEDGDLVTTNLGGAFLSRIKSYFGPKKPKYDWTIVQGGTNDIGSQIDPDRIFRNLKDIWAVPLFHGSKLLVVTVPEAAIHNKSLRERMEERRNRLNDLIKTYAKETANVYMFDFHGAMPYFTMPANDRERFWDDGLHFTVEGYELLGQKIGTALLAILAKEKSEREGARGSTPEATQRSSSVDPRLTPPRENGAGGTSVVGDAKRKDAAAGETERPSTPAKKRRARGFLDDDQVFDEENGSPERLERGYIVVRKKDLY